MTKIATAIALILSTVLVSVPSQASMFGEEDAILMKMLLEDLRRYEQLREMIQGSKDASAYMHALNAGIENSIGLLNALPVKDDSVLAALRSYSTNLQAIDALYGPVPASPVANMQTLNDNTVAESIRMANSFKDYSDIQEQNSVKLVEQSREASPKGAARMQAEASAEILRSMSQLIRLNTQMLKLQSEQMAMQNKQGKDEVTQYQKFDKNLAGDFQNFKLNLDLTQF